MNYPTETHRAIESLKERHTSLISAAVNGKIDAIQGPLPIQLPNSNYQTHTL